MDVLNREVLLYTKHSVNVVLGSATEFILWSLIWMALMKRFHCKHQIWPSLDVYNISIIILIYNYIKNNINFKMNHNNYFLIIFQQAIDHVATGLEDITGHLGFNLLKVRMWYSSLYNLIRNSMYNNWSRLMCL